MDTALLVSVLPFAFFCVFLVLQFFYPRRPQPNWISQSRVVSNMGLFLVNAVLARFVVPISLVAIAYQAMDSNTGLLNRVELPAVVEIVTAVIVLDLVIYVQHVATHKIPLLWRFHKVHHADREMDITTAVRFHPIELVLSTFYKAAAIIALGAAPMAVALFVLLLFIGPAFNHSNLQLPERLDAMLRLVLATPDVHRVHHSTHRHEQDSNYGFFLIWWDRLFGTYIKQPGEGHEQMLIGLPREQEPEQTRLDQMLVAPFLRQNS